MRENKGKYYRSSIKKKHKPVVKLMTYDSKDNGTFFIEFIIVGFFSTNMDTQRSNCHGFFVLNTLRS